MTGETQRVDRLPEDRKLDIEARRAEAEFEIRRAELEEKRAQRNSDEKRYERDAEVKRLEVTLAAGRGIRLTAAQATVAAAALALIGGGIGGIIQAWSARELEASKQEAAERLDRAKFETTLILKATESPNRDEQIRNLKFFLTAGFISDPDHKIARMETSQFPSAPPPSPIRPGAICVHTGADQCLRFGLDPATGKYALPPSGELISCSSCAAF